MSEMPPDGKGAAATLQIFRRRRLPLGKAMRFGYLMRVQTRATYWNAQGRWLVFFLAASSIACLLADFYGLCPMRIFTPVIFGPALLLLFIFAALDWRRGDGQLFRAVLVGLGGGLLAALAYDVFRLPFVFAREWHIDSIVPPMRLFKVFPRFGAMVLGQPIEQAHYSVAAQVVGWIYHFSNGATFGVMYLAIIGSAERRHWSWAVLLALGLELGMLLTPYPSVFNIPVTSRFVVVTVAAHTIFGVGLGLTVRGLECRIKKSSSARIAATPILYY
jgi:hypothetical protein